MEINEKLFRGRKRCDICGGVTGVHEIGCPNMDTHVTFISRSIDVPDPELEAKGDFARNRHERRKQRAIARRKR